MNSTNFRSADEWLAALNVKYEDLTPEELATYRRYQKALSTETLSVDSIKEFAEKEIVSLQSLLLNFKNDRDQDLYLKACMRNMKSLIAIINSPTDIRNKALEEMAARINL